ncbi:MAG: antitoxin component HigA of HigAB toxin-antitoxin module [Candidatus Azotimanducaceae bacterium]|jgi:antitoxin component HigA of HigAB toxin-antitoxin module
MDIQSIHTEQDYDLALEKTERLIDMNTRDAIRFVMEQNGLIEKDLTQFIGSSGRVSEVLSGKRPLSISMIRNLNEGLKIPADVLIKEYKVA